MKAVRNVTFFRTGLYSNRAWTLLISLIRAFNIADCRDPEPESWIGIHRDASTSEIILCHNAEQTKTLETFANDVVFIAVLGYNEVFNMPKCIREVERMKAWLWRNITQKLGMFKTVKIMSVSSYVDLTYMFETKDFKIKNVFYPTTVPTIFNSDLIASSFDIDSDVLEFENQTEENSYDRIELLFVADLIKHQKTATETKNKTINNLIGCRMNPFEEIELAEAKTFIQPMLHTLDNYFSSRTTIAEIILVVDNYVDEIQKKIDRSVILNKCDASPTLLAWFKQLKRMQHLFKISWGGKL